MAMTLSAAQIVKSLAAKFGFREEEALAHLAREFITPLVLPTARSDFTARGDSTARGSFTPRSERVGKDLLGELAVAESKDAAKVKAKPASKEAAAAAKEEAKKAKEAAKEAAKAAKEAKPKQAMTGKRVWAKMVGRKAVTEELKAAAGGEKVGIGAFNKQLNVLWKAMPEDEREAWDAKAAEGSDEVMSDSE